MSGLWLESILRFSAVVTSLSAQNIPSGWPSRLKLRQQIIPVDVSQKGASLQLGAPHTLFKATTISGISGPYSVSADGKKFVMNTVLPQSIAELLTLITNCPGGPETMSLEGCRRSPLLGAGSRETRRLHDLLPTCFAQPFPQLPLGRVPVGQRAQVFAFPFCG